MKWLSLLFACVVLGLMAGFACADSYTCSIASDDCHRRCCTAQHGMVLELRTEGTANCMQYPTKCILIGRASAPYDRVACVLESDVPDFNLAQYGSCWQSCVAGAGCSGGDSPFIGPRETPVEETPPPRDACTDVSCPRICRDEGGLPILYQDGTCRVNPSEPNGYECLYVRKQCIWACNSDGTNCNDRAPLSLDIDTPMDGSRLDTGTAGFATVDVTGSVSSSPSHTVAKVAIFTTLGNGANANFNRGTGEFSLSGVQIQKGRAVSITATAYDAQGRTLGTDTTTVYPTPRLLRFTISPTSCTIYRNGEQVSQTVTSQEGDTFEIHGTDCNVRFTYSDGTTVAVKAPAKIQYWESGIYLRKGTIEVNINRDYEVITKLARYVVQGTSFKISANEETSAPETLVVMSGSVFAGAKALPDEYIGVPAGGKLVLPSGMVATSGQVEQASSNELLGLEQGGGIDTGASSGGDSCCGSGFILLVALAGAIFIR